MYKDPYEKYLDHFLNNKVFEIGKIYSGDMGISHIYLSICRYYDFVDFVISIWRHQIDKNLFVRFRIRYNNIMYLFKWYRDINIFNNILENLSNNSVDKFQILRIVIENSYLEKDAFKYKYNLK